MKTKVLIVAGLVFGGILFTSCQKDNALIEDTSFEQMTEAQEAPDSPKTGPWSGEHDWGELGDPITNYPDPFFKHTSIIYLLKKSQKRVNLSVYKKGDVLVAVLVDGPQQEGKQVVKFDARDLPAGKYTAVLKIGAKTFEEEMTKKPIIQEEKDGPASDL